VRRPAPRRTAFHLRPSKRSIRAPARQPRPKSRHERVFEQPRDRRCRRRRRGCVARPLQPRLQDRGDHGRKGVDGSSPSEDLKTIPANGHMVLPATARFSVFAGTRRVHLDWRAPAGTRDPPRHTRNRSKSTIAARAGRRRTRRLRRAHERRHQRPDPLIELPANRRRRLPRFAGMLASRVSPPRKGIFVNHASENGE
jgi:hypothetical protein